MGDMTGKKTQGVVIDATRISQIDISKTLMVKNKIKITRYHEVNYTR